MIGILADDAKTIQAKGVLRVGPNEKFPVDEPALILDHTYSQASSVEKSRAGALLETLRRANATVILISHDELLLERVADEIWVVDQWQVIDRGDPGDVLRRYRRRVAEELRAGGGLAPISPTMRKGDGRAEIRSIELLPSNVWASGEAVEVKVRVAFLADVQDPVVGILLRTRIGLNVYGTNTELEQVAVGPVHAGDERIVRYRFRCDLCPGDYTLTAASHDPDGTWHEWLEDAVAFVVTDTRYTAGVANLRAVVTVEGATVD